MIAIDILKTIHEIWSRVYGLQEERRRHSSATIRAAIAKQRFAVTFTLHLTLTRQVPNLNLVRSGSK
jgi:hypothetical protein